MEICEHEFTKQVLSQDQSKMRGLPRRSFTVGRREVKERHKVTRGEEGGMESKQGRGMRKGVWIEGLRCGAVIP